MATRKTFSQGAGLIDTDITALVDDGEIAITMPATASAPIVQVLDSTGGQIVVGASTFSSIYDAATNILTYKNLSGGAFTGKLLVSFVM